MPLPYEESDERVDDAIRELRASTAPDALDAVPGVEWAVGGGAAESYDYVQRQQERLPLVIGLVLLLTFVVMGATFRSGPIALLSAVLNLGSVGVAFGLMTLVFQHGWFEGALGFTSPGFVIDWVPLVVMVVLVGLSMDYHVFVVSRIREHVLRGVPTRLAVRRGVAETAGVVTSAAAVMVSVFEHLRDAVDDGDEDDGRRPGLRDPHRRDADPPGAAAGRAVPAGRPGLVAGSPPAPLGERVVEPEPAYAQV